MFWFPISVCPPFFSALSPLKTLIAFKTRGCGVKRLRDKAGAIHRGTAVSCRANSHLQEVATDLGGMYAQCSQISIFSKKIWIFM